MKKGFTIIVTSLAAQSGSLDIKINIGVINCDISQAIQQVSTLGLQNKEIITLFTNQLGGFVLDDDNA